jgi:hypothetical protein
MSRMKQAKILHKIAIIHEHQDDLTAQRTTLEQALRMLRSESSDDTREEQEVLDKKLRNELRLLQEELEKDKSWV